MRISAVNAYVTVVVVTGFAAVVASLTWQSGHLGAYPIAAVAFALAAALVEARPVPWLSKQGGGEITASWTFSLALAMVAPIGTCLLVTGLASIVIDLGRKKEWSKALFNAANVCLSLGAAWLVINFAAPAGGATAMDLRAGLWALAGLVGGAVAILLNTVLTCVAIAVSQHLSVLGVVRSGLGVNLMMDGLLIAMAPIFVVVAQRSLLLLPLLLITVWAVHKSSTLALNSLHEATHDLLTGLPNRRFFDAQGTLALTSGLENDRRVALAMIDLDGFKAVNDRLGHHVGDHVLIQMAERLRGEKRTDELLARIGGDEFTLMFTEGDDIDVLRTRVERILEVICTPLLIEGVPLRLGGSIGLALSPDHGSDLKTLLDRADVAMYRAKATGGGIEWYELDERRAATGRLGLVAQLPEAIATGALYLAYQPSLNLRTRSINGVEALIRWKHPTLGFVPPSRFIPAAEQTDLMDTITNFVLSTALAQAAVWQMPDVRFAINVSARDLHDQAFVKRLSAMLVHHEVDPRSVEIEITEHTVMADEERSRLVLAGLRQLGVSIALDDFGTGYSSLSTLRTLPIDRIKLDRSFVSEIAVNPHDAAIVRSMIELAHHLDLTVVGEGVENAETLNVLNDMECDEIQGYLISPPQAPEMIKQMIDHGVVVVGDGRPQTEVTR